MAGLREFKRAKKEQLALALKEEKEEKENKVKQPQPQKRNQTSFTVMGEEPLTFLLAARISDRQREWLESYAAAQEKTLAQVLREILDERIGKTD